MLGFRVLQGLIEGFSLQGCRRAVQGRRRVDIAVGSF